MITARPQRAPTWHAFASARASAQSAAFRPAARQACSSKPSSSLAGSIRKFTPAAESSAARMLLAEARTKPSVIHAMTAGEQFHHRRCGLLYRAACHIDNRPMHLSEDPPRLTHLSSDCLKIRILGRTVMVQQVQPVPAQLDQPLRIVCQSDDQRALGFGQLRRQRHSRYIGHIGCLDASVGEIKTSRRFRSTRDANKTDIGIVETPTRLAVIMIEGKGNCVDAREILAVEQMLFTRYPTALTMKVRSQGTDDRIKNRNGRHLQPAAAVL